MTVLQPNRDSASQHKRYFQVLGVCFILGLSSITLNFETIHPFQTNGSVVSLRRVLLHENANPFNDAPPLDAPPAIRPSSFYKSRSKKKLDFFVAGFPKCGTTTLLYSFARHNETDITKMEKCFIINAKVSDIVALNRLDDAIAELNPDPEIKRAIKCPAGLNNARSLERISKHSHNAKLIVGVRHPVSFFQSYYNYRVTEIHDFNLTEAIPPAESLIGTKDWKGVSTDIARFDLYLKQLGKTDMSMEQLRDFVGRPNMAVRPNQFKVFLYSIDQMRDKDAKRNKALRRELSSFLDLKNPLPPFSEENVNTYVGERAHAETIDICESRYDELRAILVEQGAMMERWIRKEFIQSPDVTVANEKHFSETIRTWAVDPCAQTKATKRRLMLDQE